MRVRLRTAAGDIELTLDPATAPLTVANFLRHSVVRAIQKGKADGQTLTPVVEIVAAARV